MLRWLRDGLDVHRCVAFIEPDNVASRGVARNARLEEIGVDTSGDRPMLRYQIDLAGWIDPCVVTRDSPIEGSGQFAAVPIHAGEVVSVWRGGRVILDEELRAIAGSGKRYSSAAIGEDKNILWDVVEADAHGPGGANHSCDPNLWMLDEHTVCARRDISAGEELTFDYALATVSPEWCRECHCGAANCRQVVTGNDWQLPELQERYAGHFSPFINACIAALRCTRG
jgi:uncharacterized protein